MDHLYLAETISRYIAKKEYKMKLSKITNWLDLFVFYSYGMACFDEGKLGAVTPEDIYDLNVAPLAKKLRLNIFLEDVINSFENLRKMGLLETRDE